MTYLTLKDGEQLYYKDWGNKTGPVVVFSHGWPLNSDNWENQMFFLSNKGCRTVAHDRRGHGRSSQPWDGATMDQWGDDLGELIEHLGLKDIMIVGHSTGGGEIVRYCARHGTSRVTKMVLISATPPLLLQTPDSPNGLPIAVLDSYRAAMEADRAAFFRAVPTGPFFGYNRPGATASGALVDAWTAAALQASFKSTYDTVRAWETDQHEDLKNLDIPVLCIQGDDDQIVPVKAGALEQIKLLKKGTLKIYPGGAHALPNTQVQDINNDLWEFLNA